MELNQYKPEEIEVLKWLEVSQNYESLFDSGEYEAAIGKAHLKTHDWQTYLKDQKEYQYFTLDIWPHLTL